MEKGYFRRVLKNASFKKMSEAINAVHERSGKSKLGIFLDMAWCTMRYGSGYYDYEIFAFYNLSGKLRKTYVTRFISKKLNMFMNIRKQLELNSQIGLIGLVGLKQVVIQKKLTVVIKMLLV